MTGVSTYDSLTLDELQTLITRYPWWRAPRLAMARRRGHEGDAETQLLATLHPRLMLAPKEVNIEQMVHLTHDDLIERFLRRDDLRIVAQEGDAEDMSRVEIEADDDMVSEDLAEIYKKQGLYSEAIDTYRKLSLLNSEKSVYFARLIAEIEAKIDKN